MGKDIAKITRRLKARELESRILKDFEDLEQLSQDQKEFLENFKSLLLRIFKADFCFIVLKESNHYSLKTYHFPVEPDQELFEEMTKDLVLSETPLVLPTTRRHNRIKKHQIKSLLAIGFNSEDYQGAIFIGNKKKRNFFMIDGWKLQVIKKCLLSTLKKLEIKEELVDKSKELEIISKINDLQETIPEHSKLINAILKEIKAEIFCEVAFFYLKEKDEIIVSGKSKESSFVKNNQATLIKLAEKTLEKSEITEFKGQNHELQNILATPFDTSESHGVVGVINAPINSHNKKILQVVAKQLSSTVSHAKEQSRLKGAFSRYVSPEIIETMLKNQEKDYLKTKKDEVTVLFSDIRGFTKLSEKLPPETIVDMLNEHFNVMTQIILKHKGMVDKFIGDAIMAVWGAPLYQESHALRAIKAALEMQKAQKRLERKYAAQGINLSIGIGINTGEAIIGNIGSELKMDYTVIGDVVNTASRICSAADKNKVLISESTHLETQKSIRTWKLPAIQAKNKAKPVQVYEVAGLKK